MLGATALRDSLCSTHWYSHVEYGVSSSDPYVPRAADRADEIGDDDGEGGDDDKDEGDDAGDEKQPVPVAPASGSDGRPRHGKGKWLTDSFMSDRGSLKCRSRYMVLTGWELTDAQAWIYLYFPMFAPLTQEIQACWVSTWHGFVVYFDFVELYMPDRILRQFGFRQCIPAHPIQPPEARRPPNNRMYVLRNTFVEALWLEAPSYLLTESWTSVPVIPMSSCTDDYMRWYLSRSHPRIQKPGNIPSGFHVPVAPAMPPQALLDLIACEATREDLEDLIIITIINTCMKCSCSSMNSMNIVPTIPSILETRGRTVVDPNRARKITYIHPIVSRRRTFFLIRLPYQLSDMFY
ncbi:hypothetical protein M9H77_28954 [Catharanthus roseus]|uniref:Uncharacterized protein n=1 Tax=Catharanthus roseus TaxID=4058 RepID=A0ACC0AHE3_CATRO|nr:hypothetical protein M9H77_28954 [Catharanthus roseus]